MLVRKEGDKMREKKNKGMFCPACISSTERPASCWDTIRSKLIVIEPFRVGDRTDEKNWPEIPWLCRDHGGSHDTTERRGDFSPKETCRRYIARRAQVTYRPR